MNEKQATQQGLVFVGKLADREFDEENLKDLKEEARRIRKLGFKAVIVQSGSNEWGGGAKLLYAEENYDKYTTAKQFKEYLSINYESKKQAIKKEFDRQMEELEETARKNQEYIKKVEALLGKKID